MQVIIAPAKKMVVAPDVFLPSGRPQYEEQAQRILTAMQALDYAAAKTLWQVQDKLGAPNYRQLQALDLAQAVTPALFAYVGIQYQYMAPDILTATALDYVQAHLRILSGLYGVLRPFDAIVPYRLELQAKLAVGGAQNLYAFWGDKLYQALDFADGPVVNLASKEYSKTITAYLKPKDQLIDVTFGHLVDDQVKTQATYAKMARGAMVRYMAEHQVQTVEALTEFDQPDYHFDAQRSTATHLVFLRNQ